MKARGVSTIAINKPWIMVCLQRSGVFPIVNSDGRNEKLGLGSALTEKD